MRMLSSSVRRLSSVAWFASGLFAFVIVHDLPLTAGDPSLQTTARRLTSRTLPSQVSDREVELFAATRDKELVVEFTAMSSRSAWLRITNATDDVLSIQLPAAFAGVPVLAQIGPGIGGPGLGFPAGAAGNNLLGGGGNNLGGLGNFAGGAGVGGAQQGGQGVGGGFPNNNIGIGNQIGGGGNQNQFANPLGNGGARLGVFRVLPGRVGKLQMQTVCLEHGKAEPTPRMKYRIVPLDTFTGGDTRLSQLCMQLADNRISQNVAQAVAWHFANGLSWNQLAAKDRVRGGTAGSEKYFSNAELQTAMRLAQAIEVSDQPALLSESKSLTSDGER